MNATAIPVIPTTARARPVKYHFSFPRFHSLNSCQVSMAMPQTPNPVTTTISTFESTQSLPFSEPNVCTEVLRA